MPTSTGRRFLKAPHPGLWCTVWLLGILSQITGATALPGAPPYTPVFEAREVVRVWPTGNRISDRVVVATPMPGATLVSPAVVRGQARGGWFFEGEITLQLLDGERNVLARGFATAQANWMTNDFVPFEGTLTFESRPGVTEGVLVVKNNNPSDNRDLDEAMEIPVVFR